MHRHQRLGPLEGRAFRYSSAMPAAPRTYIPYWPEIPDSMQTGDSTFVNMYGRMNCHAKAAVDNGFLVVSVFRDASEAGGNHARKVCSEGRRINGMEGKQ